jgi:hypothetical protein
MGRAQPQTGVAVSVPCRREPGAAGRYMFLLVNDKGSAFVPQNDQAGTPGARYRRGSGGGTVV